MVPESQSLGKHQGSATLFEYQSSRTVRGGSTSRVIFGIRRMSQGLLSCDAMPEMR
jgi:hypothetical protein